MGAIRARAVNRARPDTWAEAKAVAAEMVDAARGFDGINYYEMYVDENERDLVNLAEYVDESAWQNWISSNRPRGARLMDAVDVLSMEVYGELSPELAKAITSYATSTVYSRLET
jgi:quinol monooxygenase YgiN